MDYQTSGMATPFTPAMAGRTAWSMFQRVRERVASNPGVMQILTGEIADSILIDPHPRHARESVEVPHPTPGSLPL